MHCERWIPVLLWRNCRMRAKSESTQPWLSESIVTCPSVKHYASTDCWKQKLRLTISLKFATAHFANLGDLDDISQMDSSRQGPNEVGCGPGKESSLAPPRSNLRSFRNKCIVLKKAHCWDFFGAPRSHSAPRELCPPCPPRYAPEYDGHKFSKVHLLRKIKPEYGMLLFLKIRAMFPWKELPWFKNLSIACCVSYFNIPGYFCPRSGFLWRCRDMGYFLCGVDKISRFVNVRLHCIDSNQNLVSKMSTLSPLEKFLRTPMFLG